MDLGIKNEEVIRGQGMSGDVWYTVKDNVLYVSVYHPSYVPRGISLEQYVQGIIDVAKLNLKKIEGAG
jgi:hypothetical protein